jgi:alpha-glucosidase
MMEEKKYRKNNEPKSLLFLYSVLFSSCWVALSNGEEVFGYGHTIESVSVNLPGKWLSANLSLIRNSTV